VDDLIALISSGTTRIDSFDSLEQAVAATDGFFGRVLPFIHAEARTAPTLLPQVPMLDGPGEVALDQRQCLAVLAAAFFCRFPGRISANCRTSPELPSINLDELYVWGPNLEPQVAKLRMLFAYFDECRRRRDAGDPLARPLRFLRRRAESSAADWIACTSPLLPPVMHPLHESIDDAKDMLRTDFANQLIGGGAIAYGCVQEEIMFCVFPELIVSRLFCPVMKPDEAIVIHGAEQFSTHTGYAASLRFDAPYRDPTGGASSWITAIDAVDLRYGSASQQYEPATVLRDLTKSWAGFDVPDAPAEVATGNWGCGAFRGDAFLKSTTQWLATCRAGKTLHYFPWDHEAVHERFPAVCARLVSAGRTVGDVAALLLEGLEPGDVYDALGSL
jgi:poly(ADP-ribose) glycohydrolase